MNTTAKLDGRRGRKSGIPKSTAYRTGIFCHRYDLQEMIIAFGLDAVLAHAEIVAAQLKTNKAKKRNARTPIAEAA